MPSGPSPAGRATRRLGQRRAGPATRPDRPRHAHTGSVRHHSPDSAESEQRQQRFLAYLADARTSDEEKGVITLVMLGHAGVWLLLAATEVTWVAVTAARVLRRRDDGLLAAVRAGVHTPT